MTDLIALLVIVAILAAAITYIVRAKRSGVKCIGCPAANGCSSRGTNAAGCGCGCGCGIELRIDSEQLK